MKKEQTFLSRRTRTKRREMHVEGTDPRNKRQDDQVTNTEEQKEIVNEPYVKADSEESKDPPVENNPLEKSNDIQKTDGDAINEISKEEEFRAEV